MSVVPASRWLLSSDDFHLKDPGLPSSLYLVCARASVFSLYVEPRCPSLFTHSDTKIQHFSVDSQSNSTLPEHIVSNVTFS